MSKSFSVENNDDVFNVELEEVQWAQAPAEPVSTIAAPVIDVESNLLVDDFSVTGEDYVIIDGVEVPLSILQGEVDELEPAAGPAITTGALSGGGSGEPFDLGSIGPNIDVTELLPYTELSFPIVEEEELTPFVDDNNSIPDVIAIPDIPADPSTVVQPTVLPVDASTSETALPGGSDPTSDSEIATGDLQIDLGGDALGSLVVNGVDVTNGGTVTGEYGELTVDVNPDGTYEYTYVLTNNTIDHPDPNSTGTNEGIVDTFNIVVTDVDGDVGTDALVLSIIDDGPVALADTADQVGEDTPVSVDVLADNGAGIDIPGADGLDTAIGVVLVDGSLTGTGSLDANPDGTFTYTPGPAEEGTISFEYIITDGDGDTSTATVTINLNDDSEPVINVVADDPGAEPNIASVDEAALDDGGSDAASDAEITSGDFNIDTGNDTIGSLVIDGVDVTTGGTVSGEFGDLTVTVNPDGTYAWQYELTDPTPGDMTSELFDVVVTDSDGSTADDTLTINIVDDVPDAIDDSADQIGENTPVTVDVLSNDVPGADGVDPDTGVTLVDGTLTGMGDLVYNGDGTFTYTPSAGEEGTITFQYEITDGDGDTDIATVTINLNDDSEPDVEVLADVPSLGAGDASVDEAALDNGGSDAASDAETTSGDFNIDTGGDDLATLVVGGIDVTNGGTVTGTYGTLTVTETNGEYSWSYELTDPSSGDDTTDVFSVVVTDEDGDTADDTLTIDIIDDVPTALDDSADQVGENTPVTVDVFANDVPGADGVDSDTGVTLIDGTLSGAGDLVDNGDGTFSYTPSAGEEGVVTFDYTITDGDGDTSTATVTINLNDDSEPDVEVLADVPSLGAGDASVDEAALDTIGSDPASDLETTTGNFAIDTGGDDLASLVVGGVDVTNGGTVTGTYGTLTVTENNGEYSWSYELTDPSMGDDTADVFTVLVTDEDGDTADDTLTIDIIDDVPTAVDDSADQVGENTPVTVDVFDNDTAGADGVDLDTGVEFVGGTLTGLGDLVDNGDGTFTYTPSAGEDGVVTFDYTITDSDGDTSTATVTINLNDDSEPDVEVLADVPSLGAGDAIVDEAALDVIGSDPASNLETTTGDFAIDTGGDDLASLVVGGVDVTNGGTVTGTYGTLTVTENNGDYSWSYELTDPSMGDDTTDVFSVVVTDEDGDMADDTLTIDIIDDVPTALDDSADQVGENTPVTVDVFANDVPGADGVDADTGVELVGGSLSGLGDLVDNGDGTFTYTPSAGEEGVVTFDYTITDSDGDTSTATVTINLNDDSEPDVEVLADVPSLGTGDASVDEAALDVIGSDPTSNLETTAGDFAIDTGGDDLASLVVGGVDVTAGGTVTGTYGTLTVTETNGEYSWSYELTDPSMGDDTTDVFTVVVTDDDGDMADDMLTIDIIDDVPSAVADTDDLAAGTYGPVAGNVITDAETNGDNGADTPGADGASITGVAAGDTGVVITDDTGVGVTVQGTYGVLTLNDDGSYSYTRDPGTDGGVDDVFTYTLADGDGDSVTTTLTISIADGGVTIDIPEAEEPGTIVDEAGLPVRPGESEGSMEGLDSETTEGTISFTAEDGPGVVSIDGVDVTAVGQMFTGDEGALTITAINAGSIEYSYTLADNTDGDATSDSFAIAITDQDGDTTGGTLTIDIIDDEPTAVDDFAIQMVENDPVTVDVFVNDVQGADSVDATVDANVEFVAGTLSGTGTLVDNGDGTFTYTPSAGEQGIVTFDYEITDGDGDTSIATAQITLLADGTPLGGAANAAVDDDGLADGNPASVVGDIDANAGDDPGDTSEASFTGTLNLTFGTDGPGSVDFAALDGTTDTVGQETVTYGWAGTTLTAVITGGARDGEDLFTVNVTDPTTGDYTVTLIQNVLHDVGPDNEGVVDASVTLSFTITDSDSSVNTDGTLTITFDDDAPTATADGQTTIEGGGPYTGNVLDNDVIGADADGSTVALDSPGVGSFGTLTFNADGSYSYEANDSVPSGSVDSFSYTVTDADGDTVTTELTFTFNGDANTASITADSSTLSDVPGDDSTAGSNADGFTAQSDMGSVAIDFGADGAGTFAVSYNGGLGAATTSSAAGVTTIAADDGSWDIVINETTGDYTFTQNTAYQHDVGATTDSGIVTVTVADSDGPSVSADITLNIDDDVPTATNDGAAATEGGAAVTGDVLTNDDIGADHGIVGTDSVVSLNDPAIGDHGTLTLNADGTYSYTPNGSVDAGSVDTFSYTVTDADGDTATAELSFTFAGDNNAPTATDGAAPLSDVDGDDNTPGSNADGFTASDVSGTLAFDFGTDGAGTPSFSAAYDAGLGAATTSSAAGITTIAADDGSWNVTINETTGAYTFTQTGPYTHALADDSDSGQVTVTLTDSDGSTFDVDLDLTINDDLPVANDDGAAATEGGADATGNVFDNDDVGADNSSFTATLNDPAIGDHGTLTLNADGSYSYTPNGSVDAGETDSFTYTLTDADGDTDTAVLTFTFAGDNNAPTATDGAATLSDVDGDDNTPGSNADGFTASDVSGTLAFDFGTDGAGTPSFSAAYDAGLGAATTSSAAGITTIAADDGSWNVTINETTGAYTFTQTGPYTHALADDSDSGQVTVTLTDSDGSTFDVDLDLTINDDLPVANDDGAAATEGGADATGNVFDNDDVGADNSSFTATLNDPAIGDHGTLTLNADGSYSYTPNGSVDAGETDSFTYTLTDADGDTDTAVLTFTFAGDNNAPTATDGAATLSDVDGDDNTPGSNADGFTASDVSGTLAFDFGDDGAGTPSFSAAYDDGLGTADITTDGTSTTITADDGSWNVVINETTGAYTFEQTGPYQHALADDSDMGQVTVTLTDSDGSTFDVTLDLTINDDLPIANDDGAAATEGAGNVSSGNVLTNDDVGADNGSFTTTLDSPAMGTYGMLVLNADGTYDYTPNASVPAGSTDSFTYTLTDADGDTDTAVLTFTFAGDNNVPTATAASAATSDVPGDDSVTGSNADTFSAQMDSGSIGINFGPDGSGSVSTAYDGGLGAATTVSNAGTTTITADDGSWTLVLNETTGAFTFTQNTAYDHDLGAANDSGIVTVTVTDSDGSSIPVDITLSIADDVPTALAPADLTTENDGTGSDTLALNSDIGADLPGSFTFVNGSDGDALLDGDGVALTSGGVPITLSGFGTGVLTATAGGNTVFTVTTDTGADTYTIDWDATIDNGASIDFTGLGFTDAGNNRFNSTNGPDDDNGDSQDLLFSAFDSGGTATVNTDSSDVSVSNQGAGIGNGEGARIDFVHNAVINGTNFNNQTYDYDQHYTANGFSFEIADTGNAGVTSAVIRVYDADDDDPAGNNPTNHSNQLSDDAGVQDTITEIVVNGTTIPLNGTPTGGFSVTTNSAGDFVVNGLGVGDIVQVFTADGYNRIEIENDAEAPNNGNGDGFSIRNFQLQTENTGDDVEFNLDIAATDADGDSITSTIDVTLNPDDPSTMDGTPKLLSESESVDLSSLTANDGFVSNEFGGNLNRSGTLEIAAALGLTAFMDNSQEAELFPTYTAPEQGLEIVDTAYESSGDANAFTLNAFEPIETHDFMSTLVEAGGIDIADSSALLFDSTDAGMDILDSIQMQEPVEAEAYGGTEDTGFELPHLITEMGLGSEFAGLFVDDGIDVLLEQALSEGSELSAEITSETPDASTENAAVIDANTAVDAGYMVNIEIHDEAQLLSLTHLTL